MKVWLSASHQQAQAARQWLVSLTLAFRRDLDDAVCDLEKHFGPCDVYVEAAINLPQHLRNLRHSQIDLLLCFARCAIACEIKSHRDPSESLVRATEQMGEHLTILRAWMEPNASAFAILFCPNASEESLQEVRRHLTDTGNSHMRAAGAASTLRDADSMESGHPLYLPSVLRRIPSRVKVARPTTAINAAMTGSGKLYTQFPSFTALGASLASLRSDARIVPRPSWHLPELRQAECELAYGILLRSGFVEIVGAPGVGKSSLVQDLCERWSHEQGESEDRISLSHCRGAVQLKNALLAQFEGQSPGVENTEDEFRRFLESDRVLWIEQLDAPSREACRELLLTLRENPGASKVRWVIESQKALMPSEFRVELKGLSPGALERILARVPSGNQHSVVDDVVRRANGLPRKAMHLWRDENAGETATGEQVVEWFLPKLSANQKRVGSAIAHLVALAPLGVPEAVLSRWAAHVCPELTQRQVEDETALLLKKLGDDQLAQIEDTRAIGLGALGSGETADDAGLGVLLVSIDQSALEQLTAGTGGGADAESYLSDAWSGNDDLIAVTLSLNLPELGPFLRSTFRRTHLTEVMSWIERRGKVQSIALRPDEAAAYRCLSVLRACVSGGRLSIDEVRDMLGPKRGDSELEHYALAVVEGIALGRDRDATDASVDEWRSRCEAESNRDLQCEMIVRLAAALSGKNRSEAAGSSLRRALDMKDVSDGARAVVLSYVLGDLNRMKVVAGRMTPGERQLLRDDLAAELFALGARVGNPSVCGDAVFYSVRASEVDLSHSQPFDEDTANTLVALLPSLEFVERVGRTRRLQALLTQGSVHRHIARWEQVPLERFLPHAANAIHLYRRVLRGALPRHQATPALNAMSYMIEVCVKLLRFESDRLAAAEIIAHARLVCAEVTSALDTLADKSFIEQDREVHGVIIRNLPLLALAVAIYDNDSTAAAICGIERAVKSIGEMMRAPRSKRMKVVAEYCAIPSRALRFARHWNRQAFTASLPAIRPALLALCEAMSRTGGERVRKRADAIVDLLN